MSTNPHEGDQVGKGTNWFFVGQNSFQELETAPANDGSNFYYFFHKTRHDLIKQFVLEDAPQTRRLCGVALILKDGLFTPRLSIWIQDKTTGATKQVDLPIKDGETRLVKARVDLNKCHENFWSLIRFLETFKDVELPTGALSVVSSDDAQLLKAIASSSKPTVMAALTTAWPEGISEHDVAMLTQRKDALATFEQMLQDPAVVEKMRLDLGNNKGIEDVWQDYFERNRWIFGYGLSLVSCETLDDHKLETIVAGNDLFSGAGKRIDALLRTRGHISSLLFCEIKKPTSRLLMETEYRPAVFAPAEDLRGGVAQVHKTLHAVSLKVSKNYHDIIAKNGDPTGEVVAVVRPRGVLVIGSLTEFDTDKGPNYERFSSFELYRSGLSGLDVITFDELLERARFIVHSYLPEDDDVNGEASEDPQV